MDVELRPWQPDDVDSLVAYANNYHIARYMNDHFPHPYTVEHGTAFIHMATKDSPPPILAIAIEGRAAGGIGIHPRTGIERKNAELGYWLAEPFWGRGIMPGAITQMVAYGFQQWDINRIFARPFGSNIASQRALEKAGFVLEARLQNTFFKNGRFEDEYIYAIRKA